MCCMITTTKVLWKTLLFCPTVWDIYSIFNLQLGFSFTQLWFRSGLFIQIIEFTAPLISLILGPVPWVEYSESIMANVVNPNRVRDTTFIEDKTSTIAAVSPYQKCIGVRSNLFFRGILGHVACFLLSQNGPDFNITKFDLRPQRKAKNWNSLNMYQRTP